MHSVGRNARSSRYPSPQKRWHPEEFIQMGIPEIDAYSLASQIDHCCARPPVDPWALMELLAVMKRRAVPSIREQVFSSLEALFSHPETLQCSFQLDPNSQRASPSDLDLTHVQRFYDAVFALGDRDLVEMLMTRVRRLLRETDFGRSPVLMTRALLILVYCPGLAESQHRGVMLQALKAMRQLEGPFRSDLERHLSQLQTPHLTELLSRFQKFLTMALIHQTRSQESDVENVAEVLSTLFKANGTSRAVSHELFYNPAINSSDFDIELDFKLWTDDEQATMNFSFCDYPFLYDSGSKSRIMQLENTNKQEEAIEGAFWRSVHISDQTEENFSPFLVLRVRRGPYLLQDTIDHIHLARERHLLKCPLKVQFEGEEGVDEGGLAKEFFQLLLKQLFDVDYGMFTYDSESRLWWFRASSVMKLDREFELAGALLGLAIFNNHILDLHFPQVVYKKLLGHRLDLEDLKEIFPDIYRSLKWLMEMESGVTGLGLYFVVDHDTGLDDHVSVELIPDGSHTKVTKHNKYHFISLYTKFLLETSIESEFNAFRDGFLSICDGWALQMFLPEELEQAICGRQMIDLHSLELHARYDEGYRRSHRVIRWFWEFAHGLTEERKRRLLSFVTGSDRVPIRGFEDLIPHFTIVRAGPHSHRLPTAHTCFNLLHLPEYASQAFLNGQLETAMDNAEGFGLV